MGCPESALQLLAMAPDLHGEASIVNFSACDCDPIAQRMLLLRRIGRPRHVHMDILDRLDPAKKEVVIKLTESILRAAEEADAQQPNSARPARK
eukprot:1037971-Lingulodinium_polyedra.AAC.1